MGKCLKPYTFAKKIVKFAIHGVRNKRFHCNHFVLYLHLCLSLHQKTSLHEAAEGGLVKAVKSLVGKGADVNIKDDNEVMRTQQYC